MGERGGLSIPYESVEEAEMRLGRSIVFYDGQPVYIDRIAAAAPGDPKPDIFRVYARPLPVKGREDRVGEEFRKFISSKNFDFRTPPMGFLNANGNAFYCSRLPKKQQKQGLNGETFLGQHVSQPGKSIPFNSILGLNETTDMFMGRYPNFEEAKRMITQGIAKSVAFSREFCLVNDEELDSLVYLYHKHDKVGFLLGDNLSLTSSMVCLKERLAEVGVRV